MPRPPLPIGTWGEIRTYVARMNDKGKPDRYRAVTNFRDHDGRTRRVERFGPSKTAAINLLKTALKERAGTVRSGRLSALSKFSDAAKIWLEKLTALVVEGNRSPGTLNTYQSVLERHVMPALGNLRLGEIGVPDVDQHVGAVKEHAGVSTARIVRSVVSNVLGLAARYGAIKANPVRDIERIEGKAKKEPRSLTEEERTKWFSQLRSDPFAIRKDLPDLCEFMLATGMRIGETLAVHESDLDLETGTVQAGHIITRVKGNGLVRRQSRTKSHERVLILPSWALTMLRRRLGNKELSAVPVFPDVLGGYRDPSNTRRALRVARGEEDLSWITSHSFRKTNATIIDEAGLSARDAADQLGHANVSMTQDVYFGRKISNPKIAHALERAVKMEPES